MFTLKCYGKDPSPSNLSPTVLYRGVPQTEVLTPVSARSNCEELLRGPAGLPAAPGWCLPRHRAVLESGMNWSNEVI